MASEPRTVRHGGGAGTCAKIDSERIGMSASTPAPPPIAGAPPTSWSEASTSCAGSPGDLAPSVVSEHEGASALSERIRTGRNMGASQTTGPAVCVLTRRRDDVEGARERWGRNSASSSSPAASPAAALGFPLLVLAELLFGAEKCTRARRDPRHERWQSQRPRGARAVCEANHCVVKVEPI
jgi:hypothetical protein